MPLQRLRDRATRARRQLFEHQRHLNALALGRTRAALASRKSAETDRADVLDTVLSVQPGWVPYRVHALQHRPELSALLDFLEEREPETVLEIGAFCGGTLYVWARALSTTTQVLAVDKPVWTDLVHDGRRSLFPTFDRSVDIELLYGDSHEEGTRAAVGEALDGEVDLLFVDGDHTYRGVRADFETYRGVLADDGVVAFHDVCRHARDAAERRERLAARADLDPALVEVGPDEWGVHELWAELRESHETREFLSHPDQMGMGIGVVEP